MIIALDLVFNILLLGCYSKFVQLICLLACLLIFIWLSFCFLQFWVVLVFSNGYSPTYLGLCIDGNKLSCWQYCLVLSLIFKGLFECSQTEKCLIIFFL